MCHHLKVGCQGRKVPLHQPFQCPQLLLQPLQPGRILCVTARQPTEQAYACRRPQLRPLSMSADTSWTGHVCADVMCREHA